MCWNERVSWLTFAIGTFFNIFNIWYFRNPVITKLSFLIQWLLLMQFFEALAWHDQKCGPLNTFATNGAMIANLTQPIIVCMLFIVNAELSDSFKYTALTICLAYISYILYKLNKGPNYTCLEPSDSCSHLDLYWWKNISGVVYCIVLFAMMLLLIRPFNLAVFVSAYIFITLIISLIFYSCGAGSIWCWFTSFAPVAIALFWKFQVN